MAKKNMLEGVPEFVVAFEEVRAKGHFRTVEFRLASHGLGEGGILFLRVQIEGFIPSKPKFAQSGVDPFVDADALLAKLRGVEGEIENVNCEVKRQDWKLWSKDESSVIGSKGSQVSLSLIVNFKAQLKKKARTPA